MRISSCSRRRSCRGSSPEPGATGESTSCDGTRQTAWFAIEWATYGIGGFSQTKTLTNPWFWFLIGTGIYYGLYQTVASGFGRRWGIRTVVVFAVVGDRSRPNCPSRRG
jgi:hypothetical protein